MPTKTVKKLKKSEIKDTLPDKPSELIKVAIRDLKRCERLKKYKIDMNTWYATNGECSVCLAGSVMAQSLSKVTENLIQFTKKEFDDYGDTVKQIEPENFPKSIQNKLIAIDRFRAGGIEEGLELLNIGNMEIKLSDINEYYNLINYYNIHTYNDDAEYFKEDMLNLANRLAKIGL